MVSRREVSLEKEKAFLKAYPHLNRYDMRIEVGREIVPNAEQEGNPPEDDGPFVAEVTRDGTPLSSFTAFAFPPLPDITLADFVNIPNGFLSAGFLIPADVEGSESDNPPELFKDVLSLTESGFGVAQLGVDGAPENEGILPETGGNNMALDGSEMIALDIFDTIKRNEDLLTDYDRGGTSLGIDYRVLDGNGTVQIVLIDLDGGDGPVMVEMPAGGAGRRRDGSEGTAEAEMSDNISAFETAIISVTGDLEIAVTGISLTTNFDETVPI